MDRQMDRWTVNEYMKLEATQNLYAGSCRGGETDLPIFSILSKAKESSRVS